MVACKKNGHLAQENRSHFFNIWAHYGRNNHWHNTQSKGCFNINLRKKVEWEWRKSSNIAFYNVTALLAQLQQYSKFWNSAFYGCNRQCIGKAPKSFMARFSWLHNSKLFSWFFPAEDQKSRYVLWPPNAPLAIEQATEEISMLFRDSFHITLQDPKSMNKGETRNIDTILAPNKTIISF